MRFANKPPESQTGLVTHLWDRHLPSWRRTSKDARARDPKRDRELVERLTKLSKAPTLRPEDVDFEPDEADILSIKRRIHRRKGSWWQVPKDLKVSDD